MCCNDKDGHQQQGGGGCCGGGNSCGCCEGSNNNNNGTTTNTNNNNHACGLCQPFKDTLLVTSQALSIFAFCVSWIFWVTFLLGLVVMIQLQVVWCCRMSKPGIISIIVLSSLASLSCLLFEIWALVRWNGNKPYCSVFFLDDDYYSYTNDDDLFNWTIYSGDYCNEVAWSVVGFIVMAMWATVAGLLIHFLRSGRYEKCVEDISTRLAERARRGGGGGGDVEAGGTNTNAIEMSQVNGSPAAVAVPATASVATPTSISGVGIGVPAVSYVIENEQDYAGMHMK